MKQERYLAVTNLHICNLLGKSNLEEIEKHNIIEIQRKIPIEKLKAASKSTVEGCNEFIVHVRQEYDYRFISDK